MSNKKIVVTGCNGYVGAVLVPMLVSAGYEVVGIDTSYYGRECEFTPSDKPSFTYIKKDVRCIESVDVQGAYAICHLAALSNDPIGALQENLTSDINYKASIRLAKIAKENSVEKFIFSSSCSMYGITEEDEVTEESVLSPLTAYAKSKVHTEEEALRLNDDAFSVTCLRNATAYGISPKLRVDLVVNNLVGWAVTTGAIRIMSDGTPWRPLIHVEDLARAFCAVIETEKDVVSGLYVNVGRNEENYQIKEIAHLVKEVMPSCDVQITNEYANDSRSYKVNFDKITRTLPLFKPQWTLRDGVKQVYDAYMSVGMSSEDFNGRKFTRLKQIKYLLETNGLNNELYWN